MKYEEIIEKLNGIKNGVYTRIAYRSSVPVKAAFKKQGVSIEKITDKTVRFGVDYDHINTVIERKTQSLNEGKETREVENNYTWIIEDKACHNSKTGKDYVRFANTANSSSHTKYIITDESGNVTETSSVSDYADYIIASYFKPDFVMPEVQNIYALTTSFRQGSNKEV